MAAAVAVEFPVVIEFLVVELDFSMETIVNHLLSQANPRIIESEKRRYESHLFHLEEINSLLFEKSRTQLFKDDDFSSLMKEGYRTINGFFYGKCFDEAFPILQPKVKYPLSYLTPEFDVHFKYSKTKFNGCIHPHNGYPCGKCLYCLEKRRLPWVVRLTHERRYWSKFGIPTYFVTLTYDDTNLPNDGVCKRDIQLFLKRLRKYYSSFESNKLKYFCVSEYGPKTHRAHYHLILFGFNRNLSAALRIISNCWNNGFVKLSKVKPSRIRYVTKYSTKFFDKLNDSISDDCVDASSSTECNPEFRLISKGIGISFVSSQNVDFYRNNPDKLFLTLDDVKYSLPRYYRDKIFDKDDMRIKQLCFEESLKKHLDFIHFYYENLFLYDIARELNGSASVFREHYNHDVKRYVDYTLKKAQI